MSDSDARIRELIGRLAVTAPPAPPLPGPALQSRRHPRTLLLAATLIVVALGGLAAWFATSPQRSGPLASATFGAKAGLVVREVVAGQYASVRADFDTTMMAGLSEQGLRDGWTKFTSIYGSFKSQGEPEVLVRGSFTVVNIPLTMESGAAQARISFHPDGKIAGLFFLRPGVPVP